MLKSTMIVFVFFCTLTNLTPTTILDQSETLTTTPIRKKTKELCDETITCFLGNPSLAKKLEKTLGIDILGFSVSDGKLPKIGSDEITLGDVASVRIRKKK